MLNIKQRLIDIKNPKNAISYQERQKLYLKNIPLQLKERCQWLLSSSKLKCPYYYDGVAYKKASTSDPSTWKSFEYCLQHMNQKYDLLGFVFAKFENGINDEYVGIDYDYKAADKPPEIQMKRIEKHCEQVNLAIKLDVYVENSLSGEGIHVIGIGNIGNPKDTADMRYNTGYKYKSKDDALNEVLEYYDRRRFFVFTGLTIHAGNPNNNMQPLLDIISQEIKDAKPKCDKVIEKKKVVSQTALKNYSWNDEIDRTSPTYQIAIELLKQYKENANKYSKTYKNFKDFFKMSIEQFEEKLAKKGKTASEDTYYFANIAKSINASFEIFVMWFRLSVLYKHYKIYNNHHKDIIIWLKRVYDGASGYIDSKYNKKKSKQS